MAASPVLVDSSFYIHTLRAGRDPLKALALTAATRDLVVCGIVRCEVGRGLRNPSIWQKFQAFWNVMINVPTDKQLWEEVEKTVWSLDRRGLVLPLTDVIVACCARRAEAVVLTYDEHSQIIPGVNVVTELPV